MQATNTRLSVRLISSLTFLNISFDNVYVNAFNQHDASVKVVFLWVSTTDMVNGELSCFHNEPMTL